MAGHADEQGRFNRDREVGAPIHATVIGRWEAERALLRTDRGAVFSVTVPEKMRCGLDVGVGVWVVLDVVGRLSRWFLDDGTDGAQTQAAAST